MEKIFSITSLQCRPQVNDHTQVVAYVSYQVDATEDGSSAVYNGMVHLPVPTDSFTTYSELMEEQVITWVRSIIDETKLDNLLQRLLYREKYGEPVETQLPWS
jgi:hypothetical protein